MSSAQVPPSREEQALARHREELRQRFPLPAPAPRKSRTVRSASALLLVFAAALYWVDPAYRQEQYATGFSERKALLLADGSQLTLDSDSRVAVSWHLRSRRVALLKGQALFDVSKTRLRPFRVSSSMVEVHVLGTLFNVSMAAQSVRVTLLRGRVEVDSGADSVQLFPGQQVQASGGQLQAVKAVDAEASAAWKDNRLVFLRTPLSQVLEQVQRYRRGPIRLLDPGLADLPISGVFDSRNVEALLATLPSFLPVTLANGAEGELQLRRKDKK